MSDFRREERLLIWAVASNAGFDTAWLSSDGGALAARGFLVSQHPEPHTAHYRLHTFDDLSTHELAVTINSRNGRRELLLRQDGGRWWVDDEPRPDLDGALDCDLAGCPLTNTMPVLRHGLLREAADATVAVAFVELPSLRVVRSEQRYTHLRRFDSGGAVVRFESAGFEADVVFDADGFVVEYPKLDARRIEVQP